MSQDSENNEFQSTDLTSEASLGSPNETDISSATDIPSENDVPVNEIPNFFNDDYLSKLGNTSEDPADDKSDLSELPGFASEDQDENDSSEEKTEEIADPATAEKPVDAANPAETIEKSEAEKAIDDDPNLSPEEKTAIKELPKNKWDEFRRAKTYARTEAKFLDPNEKISDFVGHLEQKSPARLNELKTEILLSSATTTDENGNRTIDGGKLLTNLFETAGPETYTKVVTSIVENYADTAAEILKTKGFNLVQGDSAISTDAPEIDDEKITSILADAEMYLDDEQVEYLRGALKNRQSAVTPKPEDAAKDETAAKEGEVTTETPDETAKTELPEKDQKSAEVPQATPEEIQRWDNAVNESLPVVDRHLQNLMDDTYGLSVSEIERTNIPELAAMKDDKRNLLLYGSIDGSLQPFDINLLERFRDDEDFKKAFDSFGYFAKRGENANAQNEIRRLIPFAEKLLEERMDHKTIKQKDAIIKRITESYNRETTKPQGDIFLAGNGGGGGDNPGKSENTNSFLDPSTL